MRKLILESQRKEAAIVTAKYSDALYETLVIGGELDGWALEAKTPIVDRNIHIEVVKLVEQAVQNSPVRV